MPRREESDFWVTFGSNAREFSEALPGQLSGARAEIALLKKELATLFSEAEKANPSLGHGLIRELQAANSEIRGLTTGIQSMSQELNLVVEKLRNLKIEPVRPHPGVVTAAGSAAAAVPATTVTAAANAAAKKAVAEYVAGEEAKAKAAGEAAASAAKGATSGRRSAKQIADATAAGIAADAERVVAEQEMTATKQRAARQARTAAQQVAAAAAAPPPAPTPPRPAPAPAPAPRPAPAPARSSASSKADAEQFVVGLSAKQILERLKEDGITHPSGLAQSLNISGRGTAEEVAKKIAARYQNFAAQAAQQVEKQVAEATASVPTGTGVRDELKTLLEGLNERSLHAAVQMLNESLGTSINIRTPKTDKRRNMGTIVSEAVRQLENAADAQIQAVADGIRRAAEQIAAAGVGSAVAAPVAAPYRQGPGGTYKARTAAEWETYSQQAGFEGTVEKMGGLPALRDAGYKAVTLTPGLKSLRSELAETLEKLQQSHPAAAEASTKTEAAKGKQSQAAKRIAQAEGRKAEAVDQIAAATEQEAATIQAEAQEAHVASEMGMAQVRDQIRERVQRQREMDLLGSSASKQRKQLDKIKDPSERETAIRQWESRQRQTAAMEAEAVATTMIPYEGMSTRGSLGVLRTRLLNDMTGSLGDDEAAAMARRVHSATGEYRIAGLIGKGTKRTTVGSIVDEYTPYIAQAQEEALANTPVSKSRKLRAQLSRTDEAKAAYNAAIERVLAADTQELRETESLLRRSARGGGRAVQVTRGAEPIHRANIAEVLSRRGVYGGDSEYSMGLAHEHALIEDRSRDLYGALQNLKGQRSGIQSELKPLARELRDDRGNNELKARVAQLNRERDGLNQAINALYAEMRAQWDRLAQYTSSQGPGGVPAGATELASLRQTMAKFEAIQIETTKGGRGTGEFSTLRKPPLGYEGPAYEVLQARATELEQQLARTLDDEARGRTKTHGAHTIPGPTGSIIPTPESTRDNRPTAGAVTLEDYQRLVGKEGAFQRIGPLQQEYEATARQAALGFLQENPNWDPFAKGGRRLPRTKPGEPNQRRARHALEQGIEHWDKIALDYSNYIKGIEEEILAAGGSTKAPQELLDRHEAAHQEAVRILGPTALELLGGARTREQYRAERSRLDDQPGGRTQRQLSANEMYFGALSALQDKQLGLMSPFTDPSKTQFATSDWRIRAGQVTGGLGAYVSKLQEPLTSEQRRELKNASRSAAGAGNALFNAVERLGPEYNGDPSTLTPAERADILRLQKAAQSARLHLTKLAEAYHAAAKTAPWIDLPTVEERKAAVKEKVAAGDERRAALGIMDPSAKKALEARQEEIDRVQRAALQYDEYFTAEDSGENARRRAALRQHRRTAARRPNQAVLDELERGIVDVPGAGARRHIGDFLGATPTGLVPEDVGGKTKLESEAFAIKRSMEHGTVPQANFGDYRARLAEIERLIDAPMYSETAFGKPEIEEAKRRAAQLAEGVRRRLAQETAGHEVQRTAEEAGVPIPGVATPATLTPVGTGRPLTESERLAQTVTGEVRPGDVAAIANDRLIQAITKLDEAIRALSARFSPGRPLPEGMAPAPKAGGAGRGGGGPRKPPTPAAEPPADGEDPLVARQAKAQADVAERERKRREREQQRVDDANAVRLARRKALVAELPRPSGPDDERLDPRQPIAAALRAPRGSDERMGHLVQAGVSLRREYGFRGAEVGQLGDIAELTRPERAQLGVRISSAAKEFVTAAEAARQLKREQSEVAATATTAARAEALLNQALATLSPRTQDAVREANRLMLAQRELQRAERRGPTPQETAALQEARLAAYGPMHSEYTRIDPDTRKAVLSKDRRQSLFSDALGTTGPELTNIQREFNARESVRVMAEAGTSEAIQQGGKLRRAITAMFGVNNSFGGRAIAGAGTALVRTFSYGLVFGVFNEMQKIFRISVETEAEFVRISDALNATGRSAGSLRSSLQSISSDLAAPLEEVYVTASQLTGVFTNTRDVEFATRAVEQLKLISRGALNSQEAISSLQAVTSAYGLTGADAFQMVVDKATAIQNVTGANVEQVLEGAGGIAPQARAFHLTQDQAFLYPGLIAQRTNQQGGAASEQLSRIFESLAAPKAAQFLERRGYATEEQIRGNQLGDVITNLIKARATRPVAETDADLVQLERLVGARQARPLAALIGSQGQAQQTLRGAAALDESQGAGAQRVHELMSQLNRQLKQLSVNMTNVGAALVRSGFLNGISEAVSLLNIVLRLTGQIGSLFAVMGHIPGFGFLGKVLVDLGTIYVLSKLIGTTFRSINSYTRRVLGPAEEELGARGPGGARTSQAGLRTPWVPMYGGAPVRMSEDGVGTTLRQPSGAFIHQINTGVPFPGQGAPAFRLAQIPLYASASDDVVARSIQSQITPKQPAVPYRAPTIVQPAAQPVPTAEAETVRRRFNPTLGIAAHVGAFGASAFDGPFIRLGQSLQKGDPEGRVARLGERFERLGNSMNGVGASSAALRTRMEELTASGTGMGRFLSGLSTIGNAALFAAPFIIAGVQAANEQRTQFHDFVKNLFPNALPDEGGHVGDDPGKQQQNAYQLAIRRQEGEQRSFSGRLSAVGGWAVHAIPGIFNKGQRDDFYSSANALFGGFDSDSNKIGSSAFGAVDLNDQVNSMKASVTDALNGVKTRTESIAEVNDTFDRLAASINKNRRLSNAQKTVAVAWLAEQRKKVTDAYAAVEQHIKGVSDLNQLTTDQAAHLGDVITAGLGLTGTQRRNGIGAALFETQTDQGFVKSGSDASYYLAALYGTSVAAPGGYRINPNANLGGGQGGLEYLGAPGTATSGPHARQLPSGGQIPGKPYDARYDPTSESYIGPRPGLPKPADVSGGGDTAPSKYLAGPYASSSQIHQEQLFKGLNTQSNAGRLILQGKLADSLEKEAIPAMAAALKADSGNIEKYTEDLAKFNALVAFDGQLRNEIAQEGLNAAVQLAQYLSGKGDNAGAIKALDSAIAADNKALKDAKSDSEKYGILNDIAAKERQQADLKYQPSIGAAQVDAASATNPGAQAAANLKAAQQQLNELLDLRKSGKGGVTDADISSARAAVASANQAIVANAEGLTEGAAALLQSQTLDPFKKATRAISELQRQIQYYKGRGDTAKVNELTQQLNSAKQSQADLIAESADAQSNLLAAIAGAAGDVNRVAQIGLAQANKAYIKALHDNGGNKKAPAVVNAQAAVVAARANVRDTWLQDREDDLAFQHDMGKITLKQYEDQLKAILQRKDLTKKQRQEIQRLLKSLSAENEGQWNLGDIKMPKPYDVRRAMQYGVGTSEMRSGAGRSAVQMTASSTGAGGESIGYQDNKQVQINIYGGNLAQVQQVMADQLGTSATGRLTVSTKKV